LDGASRSCSCYSIHSRLRHLLQFKKQIRRFFSK
jgi:hypothetical protein